MRNRKPALSADCDRDRSRMGTCNCLFPPGQIAHSPAKFGEPRKNPWYADFSENRARRSPPANHAARPHELWKRILEPCGPTFRINRRTDFKEPPCFAADVVMR